MTIYIPEFWCGVLMTILVEIVLFIGLIVAIVEYKGGKNDGKSKDSNDKSDQ